MGAMRGLLNSPASPATVLCFRGVKCLMWVKPRAALASFASLCLPAGIFTSHPRQAKRHPCLFPALPFAFSLNRDKTVKYFPRKWPHVISRAVHTIKLSFPSINLRLTSLPQALPQPCSSLLLSQVSASVTQGWTRSCRAQRRCWRGKLGRICTAHGWVSAQVQRDTAHRRAGGETWVLRVPVKCFMNIVEYLRSWLRSAGLSCCSSFMFSGRVSLWRIKSGPGVTSLKKHNLEIARVVCFIILKPNRSVFYLNFYLQVAREWKLGRSEEIINPYKNFSCSKLIFFFACWFARNADVCVSLGQFNFTFLSWNSSRENNMELRYYEFSQILLWAHSREQSLHWIHNFCLWNKIYFGMITKAIVKNLFIPR